MPSASKVRRIGGGFIVVAFLLMMHGPTTRLGGGWRLRDPFRMDDMALMRHAGARGHYVLLRHGRFWNSTVDEDVDYAVFHEPDCVLYTSRRQGWVDTQFFACGDHRPFPFRMGEEYRYRPDEYYTEGTTPAGGGAQLLTYRYVIPLDSLRAVAMRQPMRTIGWEYAIRPDHREKVYVASEEHWGVDTVHFDAWGKRRPEGPKAPLF